MRRLERPSFCGGRGTSGSGKGRRSGRGSALTYTVIVIPVLLLICALSVDWGRTQLVKMELRRMCDGAARYAAVGIFDGTALTKAQYVASQNKVDGQTITLTAANVEPGRWNDSTKTFTATDTRPDAVRVSVQKTVPALFASAAGGAPKNVTVRCIARFTVVGYGLVGLNSISFGGHSTASYFSSGGPSATNFGSIGSNGPITIGGSSTVNGNVYLGPGGSVSGGTVNGSTKNLATALTYPNGSSSPYGPSNNDNINIPLTALNTSGDSINMNNKTATVPGGRYFLNDFSVTGTSNITFTGPTVIYCYGTFTMTGNAVTASSIPGNLKVVMVPNPSNGNAPGGVSIGGTAALYSSIYAPQSAVSIGGTGSVYGSVLGKTINMSGTGDVYYDLSLDSTNGSVALVQ
jgi:Flp pilus assembly protein TadG